MRSVRASGRQNVVGKTGIGQHRLKIGLQEILIFLDLIGWTI